MYRHIRGACKIKHNIKDDKDEIYENISEVQSNMEAMFERKFSDIKKEMKKEMDKKLKKEMDKKLKKVMDNKLKKEIMNITHEQSNKTIKKITKTQNIKQVIITDEI